MSSILKTIKTSFVIFAVAFLFLLIYKNFNEINSLDISVNWMLICVSLFLYFLFKFTQSLIWQYITVKNDCSIRYSTALLYWINSQLGRYIPGKVFYLGGRVYHYQKKGISKSKITYCFLLETVLSLIASAVVLIISLPMMDISIFENINLVYVFFVVILLVLVVHPKIFQSILNFILMKLKRNPIVIKTSFLTMIKILLLYCISWFIMGLGFVMLIDSMIDLEIAFSMYFNLTGSFAFSSMVGLISFFAPSGIGVREGVLLFLLQNQFSSTESLIISVGSRLWVIIGDVILIGSAFLIGVLLKRKITRRIQ
ncbi:lysylphosphatidylglycerol synthase domain-containing protein [Paenibacillus lentus]|uniref:lysylphosphatidylglycerol synthase domain-containing protein n=1 Tax=Paenibacillus lentus TaxID=1338368 RepID=UPI0036643EB6